MLTDSIKTLSATSPKSFQDRMTETARINAEIVTLAKQLGVEPGRLSLNSDRAKAHLAELRAQAAAKYSPSAPVASAPFARPVELTGDKTTDAAVTASGSRSLAELKLKSNQKRLTALVASLPPGLSLDAAKKNLAACEAELKYIQNPS